MSPSRGLHWDPRRSRRGLGRRGALIVLAGALAAWAWLPSVALATHNDPFATPEALTLGAPGTFIDTSLYMTELNEGQTPTGPGTCIGIKIDNTAWYQVIGTGQAITVNTSGSSFDTVLAVYDGPTRNFVGCNNDATGSRVSRVTFNSTLGRPFLVQAGGCVLNVVTFPPCVDSSFGNLQVTAFAVPSNDTQAAARALPAGVPVTVGGQGGALEDPGEVLLCRNPAFTNRAFGKTVWFRFVAPAPGKAIFTSAGFDTVLTVYREGVSAPVDCNDDGDPNVAGPSRVQVDVTAGGYLVQVGGFTATGAVNADNGSLTVNAEFTENLDLDADGFPRPADCNDLNPGIKPGAFDIPQNGVDEDCTGRDAPYFRIRANALAFWTTAGNGYVLRRLVVEQVPQNATIELRCRGRGCPFRLKIVKSPKAKASLGLTKKVKGQRFRSGNVFEVRVLAPLSIGRVRVWRITPANGPLPPQARCLPPGARKPVRC